MPGIINYMNVAATSMRTAVQAAATRRAVTVPLTTLLIASLLLGLNGPATVEANHPRNDVIGVSGNAFPWEDNWASFRSLLHDSSAGWVRVELRWNQIQPSRSSWVWDGTDQLINTYEDLGMQQLGLLTYSVGWASGGNGSEVIFGPPTDLDAYEAYVRSTVERYKDRVHAWEIWNEPDVAMFWNGQDGGDPQKYLALLQRAHRAIKAADPNAVVLNGGLTGTERGASFLNRLLDLGGSDYLDAVAFHGYVPNDGVENDNFRNHVWPLIRQARERSGKPLWITEFGWSVRGGDNAAAGSESTQATYLARHLPLLFELGNVQRIFVFQFKDPNDQPDYFGITRSNGSARPSYTAFSTITARLTNLAFEQRVNLGIAGLHSIRFSSRERTVDVVWSTSGTRQITYPTGQSSLRVWRIDGTHADQHAGPSGVDITVSGDPILIEHPGQAPTASGVNRCIYQPETNKAVCGALLEFWEQSGGLPVFGYALTEESPSLELGLTVQYFERQRFEYHPELRGTPYQVLLGLLGVQDAQRRGINSSAPFQPLPTDTQSDANCTFFGETGHRLCLGFRSYWQDHGLEMGDQGVSYREALALFGYPVSEEFIDPESGLIVQYFERARFEYHPNNPDPYKILLGRLSADLLGR